MDLVKVRRSRPEDIETIAWLFTETIHAVNTGDYKPDQLSAWAPRPPDIASWRERLEGETIVLVAERGLQILGFAGFTPDGHLGLLYTHARFLRQGIAAVLLRAIEDEVRCHGVDHLFAEVSVTARPFFDQAGFRLITAQTVERRGKEFINYRMEKML
jgi:putative acetyltransferase